MKTLEDILRNPKDVRASLSANTGVIKPTLASANAMGATVDSSLSGGTSVTPGQVGAVIAYAQAQLGKPYRWGGHGPNAFDCSGLTDMAYKQIGIDLGWTTYVQVLRGTAVNRADLMPGDLVFPDPGHVQLYLGGGQIIEAPHTGANVRVMPLGTVWKARRIVPIGSTAPSNGGTVA